MSEYKIVTATDSRFFYALLTQITTFCHRAEISKIDLDIWDLGMTESQLRLLECILRDNWKLRKVSELGPEPFTGAFVPKMRNFAWKSFCISKSMSDCQSLLWIDAGVAITNNLIPLFERIENEGYLFIQNFQRINRDWISEECAINMIVTEREMDAFQIHGNVMGFRNSMESNSLISDWNRSSSDSRNLISNNLNHRHDQTLISILINRHSLRLTNADGILFEGSDFPMGIKMSRLLVHRQQFNWIDFNILINNSALVSK